MLKPCTFCGSTFNGDYKLSEHQRRGHARSYCLDAAALCRANAKRSLAEAERWEERAQQETDAIPPKEATSTL